MLLQAHTRELSHIEARHHEACDKPCARELKVTWPAVAGKRHAEVMGELRGETEGMGKGQREL